MEEKRREVHAYPHITYITHFIALYYGIRYIIWWVFHTVGDEIIMEDEYDEDFVWRAILAGIEQEREKEREV